MLETMTKPLNVQFEISDQDVIDALRMLSNEVGDLRGDRRLGAGAIARELIIKLVKSGKAEQLLGIDLSIYDSPSAEQPAQPSSPATRKPPKKPPRRPPADPNEKAA